MNLRSVDLNLLVILDALLEEAHVSRAADRLGLSQPATSSALERCRHLFDDPLLQRGKGMMRLTSKAESLRVPLKNVLSGVTAVIQPSAVDLMTLCQTVRVVMADLPSIIVAGPLHKQLAETAPGINLVVQPWHGASEALDALAKGAIDLASSVFPSVDPSFQRKELIWERYLVFMRKSHPAAKKFDLEAWLAYPHVVVSGRGDMRAMLDDVLMTLGRTRRVSLVVPNFLMVVPLLAGSDLIAMLPSRCIHSESAHDLAVFEPPIPVAGFPLHLAWHKRRDADPAVQHVASLIQSILA